MHLLSTIPDIGIVQDRRKKEIENYNRCEGITGDVERGGQWKAGVVYLGPVEANGQKPQA